MDATPHTQGAARRAYKAQRQARCSACICTTDRQVRTLVCNTLCESHPEVEAQQATMSAHKTGLHSRRRGNKGGDRVPYAWFAARVTLCRSSACLGKRGPGSAAGNWGWAAAPPPDKSGPTSRTRGGMAMASCAARRPTSLTIRLPRAFAAPRLHAGWAAARAPGLQSEQTQQTAGLPAAIHSSSSVWLHPPIVDRSDHHPGIHRHLSCAQLQTTSMERRSVHPERSSTRSFAATPLLSVASMSQGRAPPASARGACVRARVEFTGGMPWMAGTMWAMPEPQVHARDRRAQPHANRPCAWYAPRLAHGEARQPCQRRRGKRCQIGCAAHVEQGQVGGARPPQHRGAHRGRSPRPRLIDLLSQWHLQQPRQLPGERLGGFSSSHVGHNPRERHTINSSSPDDVRDKSAHCAT
jgi:hypothetical protein